MEFFPKDGFQAFSNQLKRFRNARLMGAAPFSAIISTKLGGSWRTDKANSDVDCYERQLDLLEVQGIQKACAMKLINGLQIDSDKER